MSELRKFSGQPILSQILNIIPNSIINEAKEYVFVTNNFSLPATQIATIYKNRWLIELLFKQIKQNFPLRYFWGESPNDIKIQVYCLLIAQLLMVVIRKRAATKKSFAFSPYQYRGAISGFETINF